MKQLNKWDLLNLAKQSICDEPLLLLSGQLQQKRENKKNHKFLKNTNNIKSYSQKKQPNDFHPHAMKI